MLSARDVAMLATTAARKRAVMPEYAVAKVTPSLAACDVAKVLRNPLAGLPIPPVVSIAKGIKPHPAWLHADPYFRTLASSAGPQNDPGTASLAVMFLKCVGDVVP